MRSLLEVMREELTQVTTTSVDDWGRGMSPVLNSVHLAALRPVPPAPANSSATASSPRPRAVRGGQIGTSNGGPGRSPPCLARLGNPARPA